MSCAPNPVAVRLCFGRVKSGPTGPLRSDRGALIDGRLFLWVRPGLGSAAAVSSVEAMAGCVGGLVRVVEMEETKAFKRVAIDSQIEARDKKYGKHSTKYGKGKMRKAE